MNGNKIGILTLETKNCTGCRACEIACSFHHRRAFSQSLSSIQMKELPERKGFSLSFFLKPHGSHLPCDGCAKLEMPFCVKYCNPFMRNELADLVKRIASGGSTMEDK